MKKFINLLTKNLYLMKSFTKILATMIVFLLSSSLLLSQIQVTGPGGERTVTPRGYHTLYEQLDTEGGGWASQDFEAAYDIYDCQGADDFIIPAGQTWAIEDVYAIGSGASLPANPAFNLFFYNDAGGVPAAVEFQAYLGIPAVNVGGSITFTLPAPLELTEGHYWISLQDAAPFATYGQWFWTRNLRGLVGFFMGLLLDELGSYDDVILVLRRNF